MCGRYSSTSSVADLVREFRVDEVTTNEREPSWNVAPTRQVLTVATSRDGSTRKIGEMKWGLVPSWAKDPSTGNRMINARAETIATSGAYKRALATRRCIVPADAYYEWQKLPPPEGKKTGPKQPYAYLPTDGRAFALGGLWETWHDAEGGRLVTCTIITTPPNRLAALVHDRMPLILPETAWDRWLSPEPLTDQEAASLLVPAAEAVIEARPISEAVNNVKNDGPELLNVVPVG